MKLYQDSAFKWTVASTLVLATIVAMTSLVAEAGPPLANPPAGNISPTFSNVESANDVIVGQNVKVGGDIRPKTGTSFALNADKVNFTKDFEAAGGGIVGKVLQVIGSIKGANGKPILLDGDAEVSGKFNIKGGSGDGIFIDNEKISRPAGILKLDGAVNITGALNALSATLGAVDAVSLNVLGPNGLSLISQNNSFGGFNITKFFKDGTPPKNFGHLWYSENPDMLTLGTLNDASPIKIQGVTYEPIKNKISKLTGDNLDLNFGSISTKAGADVTVNGALKVPNGAISGGSISSTGDIAAQNIYAKAGNIAAKHMSASSIGSLIFKDDPGGKMNSIPSGGSSFKTSACPKASYIMLSCSLHYFDDLGNSILPAPDIYKGKAAVGTTYIDDKDPIAPTCHASVWNQYSTTIGYRIQTTCFDPNG